MRMMGIFGWTARSGVSTMPATFAYRSACEEYSPRQQSIFCPLITSALSVTKERFFSSRLRANRHIARHKPSVLGRNLGDLEVDELPVLEGLTEVDVLHIALGCRFALDIFTISQRHFPTPDHEPLPHDPELSSFWLLASQKR